MIQVIDSHPNPIVFGSLESEIESFMFGQAEPDSSHSISEKELLHKGEHSKFIFGNAEDDYLLISDYLSEKNDYLLATADLQAKSLQ